MMIESHFLLMTHSDRQKTYTLAWMHDPKIALLIHEAANQLYEVVTTRKLEGKVPEDTVIVLDGFYQSGDEPILCYYLRSQARRRVFWLVQVPARLLTDEKVSVFEPAHLGMCVCWYERMHIPMQSS